MIDKDTREQIIALIHKEVVLAIGCTEPMAVALCTAKATEKLGCRPEKITALLSANILKNAMGVGIPGTGMIGLPIAIALGALIGKSDYQLEVLKDLTPDALEEGKKYISENRIDIQLKENISEKLYIEITCQAGAESQTAIIAGSHTSFVEPHETYKTHKPHEPHEPHKPHEPHEDISLNMRLVYDFATTAPLHAATT